MNNDREPWVGVPEVSTHLGKSQYTVRELAKAGAIPGTKLGSEWRFKLSLIDEKLTAAPDPWVQSPRSRGRKRVV